MTVMLVASLGLSGCSLWPWHKHHQASPIEAAPAAGATVAQPSLSWAPPQGPAASAATPQAAVDDGPSAVNASASEAARYAPFTHDEWQRLMAAYGPLAQCTDRYMASAGINGQLLGVNLVQLQKDAQVIGEARRLLGDALPMLPAQAPLEAKAELASKAVWLLMQDSPGLPWGQMLARKALARYDLALVAGPACPLDSGYHSLLTKALH